MGVCWNLVNPARREYLDPRCLGWRDKMGGIIEGPPARALVMMTCRSPLWTQLGRWHGDAVYFASDSDSEIGRSWGVVVDDARGLHMVAYEEYTEISAEVPEFPRLDDQVLVNDGRGEYLRPASMMGGHGELGDAAAMAVGLLVCRAHWWHPTELASRWHGERVELAGAADPSFTDLSQCALVGLVEYAPRIADDWARRALTDDRYARDLGLAAFVTGSPILSSLLERHLGPAWRKRCGDAAA